MECLGFNIKMISIVEEPFGGMDIGEE